ncbi:sensor histidine kinase [Noviherbaspirillum galbum]|uniref:histidine kinase n=1 Tax=Noviherbaspirillum galbum TaxID=2709383 RepID=A0A6B3SMR5_9BURK|nr:histidine kinase [Noviherbaspirillum galbum]NEX61758.1 PAS domain S-box protein [Noviherbaspirillum galbum]
MEHHAGKLASLIATLPRFPAHKVGPTLMSIIESSMDAVIVIDASREIVLVNHKVERMFGYPSRQLLEQPIDILLPHGHGGEQRRRLDRLCATRGSGRRTRLSLHANHANGELLNLNATAARVSVHGEPFLALIVHSSTAAPQSSETRRRAVRPAELRRWAASSQLANEVERRRFSRKLYDDIGQRLSVLKLDLDWLENSLPEADESVPERVAQMQGLLDNVITLTKNMASALRPPLLDDFGLLPAVEWMAENFQKKTEIACTVEGNGIAVKLGEPVESVLFRVIQEGLTNIEKHAHATQARIVFLHTDNQLDVMIQDDGIGMQPGMENKPGCYGLVSIQERIFVLGGTINVGNVMPHGVLIHATIPLEPNLHPKPDFDPP